jgi:hypothetical protein
VIVQDGKPAIEAAVRGLFDYQRLDTVAVDEDGNGRIVSFEASRKVAGHGGRGRALEWNECYWRLWA